MRIRRLLGGALSVLVVVSALESRGADASLALDAASAYVFRGATLNAGWVLQPGATVSGIPNAEGLTLGVWGNLDLEKDTRRGIDSGEFSEIDFYGSYPLPLGIEHAEVSLGYTEYTYPHASGVATVALDGTATVEPVDADREVNLVSTASGYPLNPTLGIYYGVGGGIEENLYIEGSIGHVQEISESLNLSGSAVVGYVDPAIGKEGVSYVKFSAGVDMNIVTVLASYIMETDDKVLSVDEDFVVTVGTSAVF